MRSGPLRHVRGLDDRHLGAVLEGRGSGASVGARGLGGDDHVAVGVGHWNRMPLAVGHRVGARHAGHVTRGARGEKQEGDERGRGEQDQAAIGKGRHGAILREGCLPSSVSRPTLAPRAQAPVRRVSYGPQTEM